MLHSMDLFPNTLQISKSDLPSLTRAQYRNKVFSLNDHCSEESLKRGCIFPETAEHTYFTEKLVINPSYGNNYMVGSRVQFR